MIPPVVQPGDVFQRVRMPNAAGLAGESVRVASVSGDLAQLEWANLLSATTWAAVFTRTTDPGVLGAPWNDGSYLRFSAGPYWNDSETWTDTNIWND